MRFNIKKTRYSENRIFRHIRMNVFVDFFLFEIVVDRMKFRICDLFVQCLHNSLCKMCKKDEISQRVLYICDKYDTMYTDKKTARTPDVMSGLAACLKIRFAGRQTPVARLTRKE